MDELMKRPGCVITDEQKLVYAGIYLLKKMDLEPDDGGMDMPVILPSELAPLDEPLQKLLFEDHLAINRRKERYDITRKGQAYLDELVAEAEALIDQYGDEDLEDVIEDLEASNLDVFRARFLWGWYEGEFDDLVAFQRRRGMEPVETFWAYFLTGDEFYNNLAKDITE